MIVSQTKLGSRSSTLKEAVAAHAVYRYSIISAPVYRQGYPMYRSYISIPGNRAVRVTYEDERLLDDEGKLCLNTSAGNNTLKEGIDDNLVELNTTVKYKDDATKTVYGSNNTMSLKDINGQNFTVRWPRLVQHYDRIRNNFSAGREDH